MNLRTIDQGQDGGHPFGAEAHLIGLPGWHPLQNRLREPPEATRKTGGVADKCCRSEEVDAPAGVCQSAVDLGLRHGLHRRGDPVDVGVREAVDEPASSRRSHAVDRSSIGVSVVVVKAMVEGAVHDRVEASVETAQFCGVGDIETYLSTGVSGTGACLSIAVGELSKPVTW